MRGLRIVRAKTLLAARQAVDSQGRHVKQNAALVAEKKELRAELEQVQQAHGEGCRDRRVTELEARLRMVTRQLDDAMGYDSAAQWRLDQGATKPKQVM